MIEYSFTVLGGPVGQGNLSPVPRRDGTDAAGKATYDWKRPRLVHQNAKDLRPWRQAVGSAALDARGTHPVISRDVAVCLHVMFLFQRPQSAPKRVTRHTKAPDIDKLERALLDAMTGIAYADDAQVDEVHKWRRYAGGGLDPLGAAGTPRTVIRVIAQEEVPLRDAPLFEQEAAAPAAAARKRRPSPHPNVGF